MVIGRVPPEVALLKPSSGLKPEDGIILYKKRDFLFYFSITTMATAVSLTWDMER